MDPHDQNANFIRGLQVLFNSGVYPRVTFGILELFHEAGLFAVQYNPPIHEAGHQTYWFDNWPAAVHKFCNLRLELQTGEDFAFPGRKYNSNYGNDRLCTCGLPYRLHFDEKMQPIFRLNRFCHGFQEKEETDRRRIRELLRLPTDLPVLPVPKKKPTRTTGRKRNKPIVATKKRLRKKTRSRKE